LKRRFIRLNGVLLRHLHGVETLGTYVIDERGMCRYALFDADRLQLAAPMPAGMEAANLQRQMRLPVLSALLRRLQPSRWALNPALMR
jgi:hypothetical protein